MSLDESGRYILCDGEGCRAITTVPVVLYPSQTPTAQVPAIGEGWLYIVKQKATRHFCLSCTRPMLARYKENIKI